MKEKESDGKNKKSKKLKENGDEVSAVSKKGKEYKDIQAHNDSQAHKGVHICKDGIEKEVAPDKKSGLVKRFTGLTISEHLKLSKLKKEIANVNKKDGKQISTQQTITFEKMYRDGICKVKKNYYTKMIDFFDLNYDL